MTNATTPARKTAVSRGYARNASPGAPVAYALRAAIYIRVSTAGQVDTNRDGEGFSIPGQREACLKKIEDLGAVFVDEYVDAGESARSADRPKLQELLVRLEMERDLDLVVVHKVDRLARNRADDVQITLAIKKAGARLVSVTENIDETPSGMLVHGIMSSIAEFYSRNLATEITKGLDQKAKKGVMTGRAPIGYKNVQTFDGQGSKPIRTIELDPDRCELVRWAFEAYATGDYTIKQLTEALTEMGLTTRPTKVKPAAPLYPQNVHKMLQNRVYVGLIEWKGIEYPGTHEPLVSVDTFARVQAILHSRAQSGEKPSKQTHYLRGSLFCKRCGAPLGFNRTVKASGLVYDYFFCWTRARGAGCQLPYVRAEVIEEQVDGWYERVQISGRAVLRFKESIVTLMKSRQEGAEKQIDVNRKRIVDLESERRRLLQAHLAGAVPLELLREEQDRITRQLAQAGAELANTEIDWGLVERNIEAALGLTCELHNIYIGADPTMRRRINQACWDGFDVDANGIVGARLSDPMAALVADDLISQLGAESRESDHHDRVASSRLSALVEVSGLEPPTSTLRTSFVRRPEQGYPRKLPSKGVVFPSPSLGFPPVAAR
jgi:DNA invertase Pin-like site-specific DNA recombinase